MKLPRWSRPFAAFLLLISAQAFADDHYANPIDDRFRFTAGAFLDSTTTTLRLDGATPNSGTTISGEDDLGLGSSKALPDVEIMIGMHDRHHVRLNYYKLSRAATLPLARQLQIRNDTFNAGDVVESNFDVRMLSLTYSYSFVHNPRIDLAGNFGINVLEFSARAIVRARALDQSEDDAGPFPTVGLDLTVPLSRRFYGEARAEYLKVDIQGFSGTADILHAGFVYRWRENLAFGIGYRRFNISLTSNDVGDTGAFELNNSGPQAFLRMSF